MRRRLARRQVLIGGGAVVTAAIVGGATAWRFGHFWPAPEAGSDGYVKLLAEVRDDYANGRVIEHNGWVLSQHEFDTLGSRGAGAAVS